MQLSQVGFKNGHTKNKERSFKQCKSVKIGFVRNIQML